MTDRQPTSIAANPSARSVSELLQDTATHTENVVRGEIRLAIVRVRDEVSARVRQITFALSGGVLGGVAFLVLLVAAILKLSEFVAPWLATAIVGLGTAVLAGGLLLVSSRQSGTET